MYRLASGSAGTSLPSRGRSEIPKQHQFEQERIMGVIAWIILGLIAGFIASMLVNRRGEGWFLDVILGIVGAVVGGLIAHVLGLRGITGFNLWSMLVAIGGAVLCLVVYHAAT